MHRIGTVINSTCSWISIEGVANIRVLSLHFNSLDMPGYKRDMSFIEDLIPIITKANTHAGCASRISANLMKSLKDYATAIKAQGSSTRSDIESIGPLLTSLSRYMSQVDEAVNEAITLVERPNASIEELRNKMKRVFIISGVMFIVLFVLFVIDTFRLSTKKISGFPVTLLILVCSMPLSVAVFMVMGLRMKFKERSIRDELEDWPLRDTALEQLKRVQPILTHFASCQTFKTMVPEIIRTQPSEFVEDWEELAEGKVSERKNDLLRDSGKGRATIEIKSLRCL
ncbi:hypothetical protein SCHPADRAFT_138995 [Schizopora paradoxa]|uniref:Uncharacterized protein n=1 Tax=Schizopora paradoxa TaxID=27342 RepID=A0A0H2S261_9AGAM|nr:hypothetical protein SCHPADRAFT_138995 [Schizopora paradoxa]